MSLILPRRFNKPNPTAPNLDEYEYERQGVNINFTWYGLDIHPDGTNIYMVQEEGSSNERQVPLTTPWSVAAYGTAIAGLPNVTNREGCRIRQDDGTSFWSVTDVGRVYKQSLTTAYSLAAQSSTQNVLLSSLTGASAITEVRGLYIKPDGKTLFVSSLSNTRLVEFSMSTAWDITTLAFVQAVNFTNCEDIWFTKEGTRIYNCSSKIVRQNNLSTPWDITTKGSTVYTLDLTGHVVKATALTFKPDDLNKLYIMDRGGSGNYRVNQYKKIGT